jgi:hypothetical protein
MLGRLFGGGKAKPPNRKMLAQLLCGQDFQLADSFYTAMALTLLRYLNESNLVEKMASEEDRANGGAKLLTGCAMQFMQGGPERIGFTPEPLTGPQVATAFRIYKAIVASGPSELLASAKMAAVSYAMFAWYAKQYDQSAAIATHVIENVDATAGEAYRIRAFSHIMLGDLEKARADLRHGLSVTPSLGGAQEPLDALERVLPSRRDDYTTSLKGRLLAGLERNPNPIAQQAVVQPLKRFDDSPVAADPRVDAVATALAVTTYEWLNTIFDAEVDFYPNVRPTDEICADLSAFIVARLASRAQPLRVEDISAVSDIMYPANEKSCRATALLNEFESAEHDPNDKDLSLKWARIVRSAVDSLIVGDADKYVNADNGDAIMKRIVALPATLPYDNVLPDTVNAIMAEMGRRP